MDNVIKAIGSAVRGLRNAANSYTDHKAKETISESKAYTDDKTSITLTESKAYSDSKASLTLAESKAYTNNKVKEGLPAVSTKDNGKFLRVTNGKWAAEAVPNAEDGEF